MSTITNHFEIENNALIRYTGSDATVFIPDGVQEIGTAKWMIQSAFQNNKTIVRVIIPEGVTTIHSNSFYGCENLEEVTFPSTLKEIESSAFSACSKLKKLHFPEGLEKIEQSSFFNCEALTEVTIPKSVTEIGPYAFSYCENIKQLMIGEHTKIGTGCFSQCKGLANEEGFVILRDVLYSYHGNKTEVTIPEGVREISYHVMNSNKDITKLIICEGVEKIDDGAFEYLSALTEVTLPNTLKEIGSSAFSNCSKLTNIEIPDGVKKMGGSIFYSCAKLNACKLPSKLKAIPNNTFRSCEMLETIEIPDTVKKIGSEAFAWCKSLKELTLPKQLQTIEESAFGGCENIKYVFIPESVTNISSYHSWNLETFHKDTLTIIKKQFKSMNDIKNSFYWNGFYTLCSLTDDHDNLIQKAILHKDCDILFDKKEKFDWKQYDVLLMNNGPKIKFPAIIRNLACLYRLRYPVDLTDHAKTFMLEFVGKNIKKLAPYLNILPEDGLVSMLEEVDIINAKNKKALLTLMGVIAVEPKKAKNIKQVDPNGEKTPAQWKKEWNLKKLEDGTLCLNSYKGSDIELVIPEKIGEDKVSTLGKECLSCSDFLKMTTEQREVRKKIRSVTIPEGVTEIGDSSFYGCESLESVTLPKTLQKIGQFAFGRCINLKQLQNLNKNVTVGKYAFRFCERLADEAGFVCINDILCDYVGSDNELVIPDGVKEIADSSVYYHKNITKLTIPASVEMIHTNAFDKYSALRRNKTVIVGMTNSEAETFATQNNFTFQSIGVVEKKKVDEFDIKDGELKGYHGNAEEVIIPNGVTKISASIDPRTGRRQGVFYGNTQLTKVVVPEGVKEIADYTFYYCTNLKEIHLPDTIEYVNEDAFRLTPWMEEQKETLYIGKVLVNCKETCEEYHVKPGTVRIGNSAFSNNRNIKKIVIPEGVTSIGHYAFANGVLEELVLPSTVTDIGEEILGYYHNDIKVSGTILHQKIKLPAAFKAFYCGSLEDTAWIVLYQPDKAWQTMVSNVMQRNPENVIPTLEYIAKMLPDAIQDKTVGNRVAAFLQSVCVFADAKSLQSIYHMLKENKHASIKKLESNQLFMQKLNDEKEDVSNLHPIEAYVVEHLKFTNTYETILNQIPEGVRYANSEEVSAPRVAAFVISEYVKKHNPESCKYISEYEYTCTPYSWSEEADEVMKHLDYDQMMDLMKKIAELNTEAYWLPYARYADEKRMVELLSQIKEWGIWYKHEATGRKNIIVSRCGLLLNDTKSAMMHLDTVGQLSTYAAMRNTDAETLRDTVLSEFDFDKNREKKFDLGGNTLIVRIADDLSLSLYDSNAKKIVKSVPKKNATPELYEKVKSELSDLKKNIKKVVTNRRHALFAKFLNGSSQDAQAWARTYLENPVLYSVARLLVWEQDHTTFVLEDNTLKDCDGNEYKLTDSQIRLAHPMEMSKETVDLWRTYFKEKGLKQPFEQIWEPSYQLDNITENRYQGSEINVYRMNNKDIHGIHMYGFTDYSEDYGFDLDDCTLEYEASEWRFIHGVTDDAVFKLGKFKVVNNTRKANHIIYLLDKWTITERLLKDDVSIKEMLFGFTVAQITEFIKLATENNCINCTAMLLEFKNANFGESDPFEEFTLDF